MTQWQTGGTRQTTTQELQTSESWRELSGLGTGDRWRTLGCQLTFSTFFIFAKRHNTFVEPPWTQVLSETRAWSAGKSGYATQGSQETPVILGDYNCSPIDQDAWTKHLAYLERSPPELVALYGLNRHATLQLLHRLKVEDLKKAAFHPELKAPLKVADMVERLSAHGPNHLEQIERLKKEATRK